MSNQQDPRSVRPDGVPWRDTFGPGSSTPPHPAADDPSIDPVRAAWLGVDAKRKGARDNPSRDDPSSDNRSHQSPQRD